MQQLSKNSVDSLRRLLFILCLLPCIRILTDGFRGDLGPEPVSRLLATTGIWSLNLLLATLAVTPLRKVTGWNWLMRLRRTVALYSFFYVSLHLAVYLVFEQAFDIKELVRDLLRRMHVTAGWIAFIVMLPLAITSTNSMMKRLGGRNWRRLHRLTYWVGICAVFHYFWLVKRDITIPSYYALVLLTLLAARCMNVRALNLFRRRIVGGERLNTLGSVMNRR